MTKLLVFFKLAFGMKIPSKKEKSKERLEQLKQICVSSYLDDPTKSVQISPYELSGLIEEIEYYRGYLNE